MSGWKASFVVPADRARCRWEAGAGASGRGRTSSSPAARSRATGRGASRSSARASRRSRAALRRCTGPRAGRSCPTPTGWPRTSAPSSPSPSGRSGSIPRTSPTACRPACCRSAIDAGLAFGTGTHATTRGCLKMLATLDPAETANAVDVGCGSGILAIAMAKLWQRPVLGGDNDAEAVAVARENAGLNGVGDLCRFVHASRPASAPNSPGARPTTSSSPTSWPGRCSSSSDSFAAARAAGRPRAAERAAGRAGRRHPVAAYAPPAASPSSAASTSRPAARGGARCCCAAAMTQRKKGRLSPALLRYAYATLQAVHAARRKFWLAATTAPVARVDLRADTVRRPRGPRTGCRHGTGRDRPARGRSCGSSWASAARSLKSALMPATRRRALAAEPQDRVPEGVGHQLGARVAGAQLEQRGGPRRTS